MVSNKGYDWAVKKILAGDFVDIFKDFNYGTVNMATGTGKTYKIILGIYTELMYKSPDKKHVFDLSSPRLKLNFQTAFNVIYTLYMTNAISPSNTCIVLNSSENPTEYEELLGEKGLGFSVRKIDEMNKTSFKNYITISCYPSHGKLDTLLKNERYDDYFKVSYWDESHTITLKKNTKLGDYFDVVRSIRTFDKVFSLDATPSKDLTEILRMAELGLKKTNNPKQKYDVEYIYQITPKQAIDDLLILPVYMFVIRGVNTDTVENQVKHAIEAMNDMKSRNPDTPRKVLITCPPDTNVMESMENLLIKKGYKVYSTCSKNGFSMPLEDENGDLVANDVTIYDFINMIRDEQSDCFVLHMRQLIEGIDIDSLTGTVFFGVNNADGFRVVVQTIGRTLRIGKGDRDEITGKAKPFDERIKKYGEVYFVVDEENYDYEIKDIEKLFRTVYETGDCRFSIKSHGTISNIGGAAHGENWNAADDYRYSQNGENNGTRTVGEISEFIVNVEKLLESKFTFANNSSLPDYMRNTIRNEIKKSLSGLVIKECNTLEYLVDKTGMIHSALEKLNTEAKPKIAKVINEFNLLN